MFGQGDPQIAILRPFTCRTAFRRFTLPQGTLETARKRNLSAEFDYRLFTIESFLVDTSLVVCFDAVHGGKPPLTNLRANPCGQNLKLKLSSGDLQFSH